MHPLPLSVSLSAGSGPGFSWLENEILPSHLMPGGGGTAFNPRTWEAQAGISLRSRLAWSIGTVPGESRLHRESRLQTPKRGKDEEEKVLY